MIMGNKEKWVIQTSGLTLASSVTLRLSCPSSLSHYQVTTLAGLSLTFVFSLPTLLCRGLSSVKEWLCEWALLS